MEGMGGHPKCGGIGGEAGSTGEGRGDVATQCEYRAKCDKYPTQPPLYKCEHAPAPHLQSKVCGHVADVPQLGAGPILIDLLLGPEWEDGESSCRVSLMAGRVEGVGPVTAHL